MVKMVSLKRTQGEKKAADEAVGEPMRQDDGGADIHLDHRHLKKLGIEELPKVGSKHTIHGHGHVTHASSDDGPRGENRRLTIRITKMGMEPDDKDTDEDSTSKDGDKYQSRGNLRGDIARYTEESEAKSAERQKAKEARRDAKVPEKAEGK